MDRVRYTVGIITLLLAAAGGWYLIRLLGDEDKSAYFRLHVELRNVEGLLPGADVKYRGVQVGSVRRVTLREDGRKGIAILAITPGWEDLVCTNSRFWIVTPRFGGITSGASGLETLVRDAYVSFLTPDPAGPRLTTGSTVTGWEEPYEDPTDDGLMSPRRGDLLMTLLVPENHGLVVGSPVQFRGVQCGEVRRVSLANDGSHVRLELRVDREYRSTVTDRTSFWVARPRLSGGLVGGMALDDLSALISAFVSYHTEPGAGSPVADGYLVAAEPHRPEIKFAKVPTTGLSRNVVPVAPAGEAAQLARVVYEAIEDDWWSADDEIRREGTGVVIEDSEGQLLVVTARSLCDANYFDRDTFGALPDVSDEQFTVILGDGNVVRGHRSWASQDVDLAVVVLDVEGEARADITFSSSEHLDFSDGELPSEFAVRALSSERTASDTPSTGSSLPDLENHRGGAIMVDGVVFGILGQKAGDDPTPTVISLSALPDTLRPSR